MSQRKQAQAFHRAIEPLEQRVLLSAGVLDPSFDFSGTRTVEIGLNSLADAVAFQLNNRSIVVGSTQDQANANTDALIARFNQDGTIDTTFGTAGSVTLNLGGDDVATAVAIEPTDGKIVVVGNLTTTTNNITNSDIFIARYTTDGVLDTSFNFTGVRVLDLGGIDLARGVAVTNTGRIIIAGASGGTTQTGMAIVTLNPNGSLDGSFGGSGIQITSPGNGVTEEATGIALDPNSSDFYVSGFQSNASNQANFMVAKFTPDGTLDPTFGNGGRAFANFGRTFSAAYDVAVDPITGGVIAAGATADGQPDLPPGVFSVSSTGSATATTSDFAIARFTSSGALDPTFNTSGQTTEDFPINSVAGNFDVATSLVTQPNGSIIVGGWTRPGTGGNAQFAVSRLISAGTPDVTFGINGQTVTPLSGSAMSYATRLQPDGKIFQVGTVTSSMGGTDLAMVRYLNDITANVGPTLSINNVAVSEGNIGQTNATFTVTLTPANKAQVVTVNFRTVDGTAIAGQDYVATTGTLVFAPGVTTQTVTVPVIGDFTVEPNETFTVQLSSATNATIGLAQGTGTIINDDGTSTGSINVVSVTPSKFPSVIVGGAKNAKGTVNVVITNPTNARTTGTVQVQILTSPDGTVSDSTPVIGQVSKHLTLKPGQSKTIKVKVTFPAVASDSSVFLVARTSGIGATSTNGVQTPITVHAPTVSLVGSSTAQRPLTLHPLQSAAVRVPITNAGNSQAKGSVVYSVLVTANGDATSPLATLPATGTNNINLAPGRSTTQVVHFDLPDAVTLPPGNYTLLVVIVNSLTTPANTTDGSIVAIVPVTIA